MKTEKKIMKTTDFDLSLLIYGITLTDTERTALSNNTSKAAVHKKLDVVRYIEDKDIFIVNERLMSSQRYNNGSGELEKKLTKNKSCFVYSAFSDTTVILNDIKSDDTFEAVGLLIESLTRFQSFTNAFKTDLIYQKFLQKDDLEFTDETQLHDYIFYILTMNKTDAVAPSSYNGYKSLKDIKNIFLNSGWVLNGETADKAEDIIKVVLEKDNWRFYILHDGYDRFSLGLVHSNSPYYSYVDADRQFYGVRTHDLNKPLNDIGARLSNAESTYLQSYIKNKYKLEPITRSILDSLTNAEKKKETFSKRQTMLSSALQKKVEYKLKLIKNGTESFKLNDIEYSKDTIEYSGQTLEILSFDSAIHLENIGFQVLNSLYNEAKEEAEKQAKASSTGYRYYYTYNKGKRFQVQDLKEVSSIISSINDISFDVIYDEFMAFVELEALYKIRNKYAKNITIKIGDVKVKITTKILTNKNGIQSLSIYLNGNKIVRDDVFYCVHQAISYDDQNKYDEFLQSVSYTSLKIHKLTKSGLYLNFHDYIMNKTIKLTIPVKRVKNKNYLVINNKDKAIRKTDAILRLPRKHSILEIIKVLIDDEVVTGLKYDDLKGFIEKGQEAYQKLQQQKTALIDSTVEALAISKEEHVILGNGNILENVYKVNGSLRSYYVESTEPYRIYSEKEGRYICMLDKTPYVSPEVKLISRFYALKNDSVISKEVATLDF
jgi:hypothetical protein